MTIALKQIAASEAATGGASIGPLQVAYVPLDAGVGGIPDDVVVYSSNAPFAIRVLNTRVHVSTSQAASTATVRDALAGLGNALSSDLSTASTGTRTDSAQPVTPLVVPAGGTLVVRRTNNLVVGTMVIQFVRF